MSIPHLPVLSWYMLWKKLHCPLWSVLQVAAAGKMCILPLDVKRSTAVTVPNVLKVFLAPGAGLAQAVRAGLPPTTKEPQIQLAIQAATAEAEKAKVSPLTFL